MSAPADSLEFPVRRIVLFSITLLVGCLAIGLGIWQLRRHRDRVARNQAALAARTLPVLTADSAGAPALFPQRRALIVGTLDEPREFLLRGRVVSGVPAVMVITPLRRAGTDTAVLINRGYVPAPDAVDPGAATWSEAERQTWHGVLLPVPDRGDGQPVSRAGRETWHALDLAAMRRRLPYPIADVYLLVKSDSEGDHSLRGTVYPFRAEPPPLDRGPHLSYALQWFGIATAVVAFGVFFILRPRPRAEVVPDQEPVRRDLV